jgi:hypothetical protein
MIQHPIRFRTQDIIEIIGNETGRQDETHNRGLLKALLLIIQ